MRNSPEPNFAEKIQLSALPKLNQQLRRSSKQNDEIQINQNKQDPVRFKSKSMLIAAIQPRA